MSKRVLKWPVPVDDEPHPIGWGKVLHVACQDGPETVQVWTEETTDTDSPWRPVQVFGTGHSVPSKANHLGSVVTADGALVWHLYELEIDK